MRSTKATTLTAASIDKFRSSCIARGHSQNTAKAYTTDLRMLLQHTGTESIPMDSFEMLAQDWLNETRATASPKTTGRRLTSLRAFARWAGWENELHEYRAPKPGRAMPHPIPERAEGLARMVAAAHNPQHKALIGSCGYIGMRIGEALAFHTSWFDPHERTLRIRGKGDKERIVPVSSEAWDIIEEAFIAAMMGDGYLIKMQDRSARKAITSIGKRAGLSREVSSHDLRATFATVLLEKGVNIRIVQELLGHTSVEQTIVYTGTEMRDMRDAVEF